MAGGAEGRERTEVDKTPSTPRAREREREPEAEAEPDGPAADA